jgi:hypothetical protein
MSKWILNKDIVVTNAVSYTTHFYDKGTSMVMVGEPYETKYSCKVHHITSRIRCSDFRMPKGHVVNFRIETSNACECVKKLQISPVDTQIEFEF